jgi:ATP-dependent Clp protease adapter protein ClpS
LTTTHPAEERVRRSTGSRAGDAWRVIVLNDNQNIRGRRVRWRRPSRASTSTADAAREPIHNTGQAIVWTGEREVAELYHSQLEGHTDDGAVSSADRARR